MDVVAGVVDGGWRSSSVVGWTKGSSGNDVWMTKLTFTVPSGKTVVLIATDFMTPSELVAIWSANGTQVGTASIPC